jgi:hypothetical protein
VGDRWQRQLVGDERVVDRQGRGEESLPDEAMRVTERRRQADHGEGREGRKQAEGHGSLHPAAARTRAIARRFSGQTG